MIAKKNITKVFYFFIFSHLLIWTLIPTISNVNLPLDTIEALAWGSNLDWGFSKHPPFSAFAAQVFYWIFGANDWSYYFLSQIFVTAAFFFVWKFSIEIFDNNIFSFLSVLILSGIYFYNFTSPEFNVNISQLPFWASCVYFFWKGLKYNKKVYWVIFGILSALGFLSKYLFIYLLASFFIYFIININKYKKLIPNYFLSLIIFLIILIPHFTWLIDNNLITIFYGLNRSGLTEFNFINHLTNPIIFLVKQIFILIPFFLMLSTILKKIKVRYKIKNNNFLFLLSINLIPFILVLLTSIITGANIRTMWMTPFYLFLGTLFFIFKENINLKK